jgi:flagellar biosynthesis/type III secretory pathway protein FliH
MTYSSADDFYREGYEKGLAEGLARGRAEAAELLREAKAALARIEARKDEDVDEWAKKLGNDMGQFTD